MASKRQVKRFYDMLLQYSQAEEPARRRQIEATLWKHSAPKEAGCFATLASRSPRSACGSICAAIWMIALRFLHNAGRRIRVDDINQWKSDIQCATMYH